MKYVDKIDDIMSREWANHRNTNILVEECDKLIKNHEEGIDVVRSLIEDSTKQIKVWETEQARDASKNYQQEIEAFALIVEFFQVNGRLGLIEMDINTAYKNLFTAKSEYEYRFYARRIYTLLYETRKGLVIPAGNMIPRLVGIVDDKHLKPYKDAHKNLVQFLNAHDMEFKDIRNTNEAHKFKDYELQVASIEGLSVAGSIEVIQEANVLLAQMNFAFLVVQTALSAYLGTLMKIRTA